MIQAFSLFSFFRRLGCSTADGTIIALCRMSPLVLLLVCEGHRRLFWWSFHSPVSSERCC